MPHEIPIRRSFGVEIWAKPSDDKEIEGPAPDAERMASEPLEEKRYDLWGSNSINP